MADASAAIRLYIDVNVHAAITEGLRVRGHDVLTAQEDGMHRAADPTVLDRATALGRVVVTHDADFLVEAARRQQAAIPFAGILYAHPLNVTIGQLIDQIELVVGAADPQYMEDRVEWLPM